MRAQARALGARATPGTRATPLRVKADRPRSTKAFDHKDLCNITTIIYLFLLRKSVCNKAARSRVRSPLTPPAVTSLCGPWSYSLGTGPGQRAVTWGLRILDKARLEGENGLKGAARTRGFQFCCINLYAHATPLSAQIAEWQRRLRIKIYATLYLHFEHFTFEQDNADTHSARAVCLSRSVTFDQKARKFDHRARPVCSARAGACGCVRPGAAGGGGRGAGGFDHKVGREPDAARACRHATRTGTARMTRGHRRRRGRVAQQPRFVHCI